MRPSSIFCCPIEKKLFNFTAKYNGIIRLFAKLPERMHYVICIGLHRRHVGDLNNISLIYINYMKCNIRQVHAHRLLHLNSNISKKIGNSIVIYQG